MTQEIDKSDAAKASSANARINIPLNLENWKRLPDAQQSLLIWFHQHMLNGNLGYQEAQDAIGYDNSTIFRVLKGTYSGSWDNVCKAIESYKNIVSERGSIIQAETVDNSIAKLIYGGLDYARANNSITTIIGESRMGKTVAALKWQEENNHGTSVYVVAPPIGGVCFFLRRIASAVGVNKNQAMDQMSESIYRAFNKNRILIVDEAHRLLPGDSRTNPQKLEMLRDIRDMTGCALALIATQRFDDMLSKSAYMYEQILGRIGMPVRLKREIPLDDILPIVKQYVRSPSKEMRDECKRIANEMGRLGILVETLKVASRISSKRKEKLSEEHFWAALKLRTQMMGEILYAKKGRKA